MNLKTPPSLQMVSYDITAHMSHSKLLSSQATGSTAAPWLTQGSGTEIRSRPSNFSFQADTPHLYRAVWFCTWQKVSMCTTGLWVLPSLGLCSHPPLTSHKGSPSLHQPTHLLYERHDSCSTRGLTFPSKQTTNTSPCQFSEQFTYFSFCLEGELWGEGKSQSLMASHFPNGPDSKLRLNNTGCLPEPLLLYPPLLLTI